MIKNEDYKKILKMMVSCVSHGDYYSIKELSNLELEVMKLNEKNIKKEINRYTKKLKNKIYTNKDELDKEDLAQLFNLYSTYILEKIEEARSLSELQLHSITFEEFIKQL